MNPSSNSTKPSFLNGIEDNNLDVSAASYLGGSGDDSARAVDISLDGQTVIIGGQTPNHSPGGKPYSLLGGGDGIVMRYDSQTNQVLSNTRLPGQVRDLEVNPNTGEIAVAYGSGIAVLSPDASTVIWSKPMDRAERIAVSSSGKVAVLQDFPIGKSDRVTLYSSSGAALQDWSSNSGRRYFQDVAISDQDGGAVVITGFKQARVDLQVAFTQAWTYDGQARWSNYDYSSQAVDAVNLLADTRGERIAFGQDGKLYSANWVNGGIGYSIFSREPSDLAQKVTEQMVITDKYTNSYNTSKVAMTWYGEYDLKTGGLVKGQGLVTRRSDGKGNSITPDAITADKDGNIYLSGSASASIQDRDSQKIEGQQVSGYVANDGFLAIISPDLKTRYAWTPISSAKGTVIAVRDGVAAIATTTNFKGSQITDNPIQGQAGGGKDGYFLILGGQDVPVGTPSPSAPTPPIPQPEAPTPPLTQPDITPRSPIRIEAEKLKLNGYQLNTAAAAQASGDQFISLKTSGTQQGTAEGVFQGPAGLYQIQVGYYDENDGRSAASFSIGGQTKRWTFDQKLPSNWVSAENKVVQVIDTLSLTSGDAFMLSGQRQDREYARFDYVDFIPVESNRAAESDPPSGNSSGPMAGEQESPYSLRVEAESLQLQGYQIKSVAAARASGNQFISLKNSKAKQGTAKGIFNGPEGLYEIRVGYYDENDGQSAASFSVGGKTQSWTFDQKLPSNWVSEKNKVSRAIDTLALQSGDAFTISGQQQAGEFARFDYVDFVRVGSRSTGANSMATTDSLGQTLEDLTAVGSTTHSFVNGSSSVL
ncbi:hypothetical protein IQ241_05695 [Romeria aff. gracilis LEGE 07310]|uniref:Uncharacterized protein n=1 Tax=Vasconcelosia minhoensis LEGE 07310 TaxID=915328 RepID=A0A8J7DAT3_9CYAN|nr:hypothetical protein [Romeria gracilis]MBE9076792.1 hypothetical protein [Romeria aff. gracilis LEGE 07310]